MSSPRGTVVRALSARLRVPVRQLDLVILLATAGGPYPGTGLARPSSSTPQQGGRGSTVPTPDAFTAVVDAAARGDVAAWDRLFDRFYGTVLRYSMSRLGSQDAAEEIVQEVFVSAVRAIGRLRDSSEPAVEAWFLAIARNRIVDRGRRVQRWEALPWMQDEALPDAAELATARLAASAVGRAMEQLTEEQREIVVRRFVLDQSLEQVATALGKPVGAIKSMQHRALNSLNRLLDGVVDG